MKEEHITYHYRKKSDPQTGRCLTQLTSGNEYCYPLYYYGPTITADGGTLIFYRYCENEVQNWKLDIASGKAVRLTAVSAPDCLWRPWDEPGKALGVREQMSAFSQESEEMTYFDGNVLHAVNIRSLEDRVVYELPSDRVPCGLPGLSRNGKLFAFTHVDRQWWEDSKLSGTPLRHKVKRCHLDILDMESGKVRPLVVMNAWLTHANFYDDERIIFSNPPTEHGLLLTDIRGGWYAALRTQTTDGISINHRIATKRGIFYETVSPLPHGIMGYCNPDTFVSQDFYTNYPVSHLGCDPEGRLWFAHIYENKEPYCNYLAWLPQAKAGKINDFAMLTGGFLMYGNNQRSHPHPVLMPDRKNILFTAPDKQSKSNHIFLLDVSDLQDKETKVEAW